MTTRWLVFERGGEIVGKYCRRHARQVADELRRDKELDGITGEYCWTSRDPDGGSCDLADEDCDDEFFTGLLDREWRIDPVLDGNGGDFMMGNGRAYVLITTKGRFEAGFVTAKRGAHMADASMEPVIWHETGGTYLDALRYAVRERGLTALLALHGMVDADLDAEV